MKFGFELCGWQIFSLFFHKDINIQLYIQYIYCNLFKDKLFKNLYCQFQHNQKNLLIQKKQEQINYLQQNRLYSEIKQGCNQQIYCNPIQKFIQQHNSRNNFHMMINNNPYNLPQRPPNKPNRIYTDSNTQQYRPLQVIQSPTPYSQYLARQGHHPNNLNPKSSLVVQENTQYRHQNYQNIRNEIKHYLPSPKNQNTSGQNLNNFNMSSANNSGGRTAIGSSIQKKQINNPGALRESFGMSPMSPFDMKQINQKIQNLSINVKTYEKRISELQKNSNINFLPNNSKFHETDNLSNNLQNVLILTKYQNEWMDNFNKIKLQLDQVREQLKSNKNSNNNKVSNQLDRVIAQKCREALQDTKLVWHTQLSNSHRNSSEQLKKQVQGLRQVLQDKMKKNLQFLTSVIGRLQRQCHNGLIQPNPTFKSSPIKCSTTAILLRFLQCFKVRKHSTKSGQTKITLADTTYYIDNQGYLLDKDQFYIVDLRDCRVRLQQQHLKLLKQQGILL